MYKGYKIFYVSNETILLIGIDFVSFCKKTNFQNYETEIYNCYKDFRDYSNYPIVFVTWNGFLKPEYDGRSDLKSYFESHYPNLKETDLESMPKYTQENNTRGIPII